MELCEEMCKLCKKSGQLEYLIEIKKIILCKNCHGIFRVKKPNQISPSLNSTNFLKLFIHSRISKIQSESYIKYLKQKTDFSFKTSLDIGSGLGHFVQQLNHLGVDGYGIESEENTVKHSVTIRNQCAYFDEHFFSEKKYDLISLNNCLYYFHDSFLIINKVVKMLNNDGLLFLATINPESSIRIKNYHGWAQGFGMCLSKKNFQELDQLGLKIVDISSFNDNLSKDFLFFKIKKMNKFTLFIKIILYLLKIKKMIEPDIDGIQNFVLLKKFVELHDSTYDEELKNDTNVTQESKN